MAGEGSRFKINGYELPKPLIDIDGKPMIQKAIESLGLVGKYIYVIREYDDNDINSKLTELLNTITPNCVIIKTDKKTNGSTETCLLASSFIDNDEPLIITNCDQLMAWDSSNFINYISKTDHDGIVVTYDSTDTKNSFARINRDGFIVELAEKKAISNIALIGLHYWRSGNLFVQSANEMLLAKLEENGEYYIAPTYNFLISKGKKIVNFHLKIGEYIPVGTPDDLNLYLGKKREYNKNKPKTILCDLDGTILKHAHKYSQLKFDPKVLNGVKEKFDEWDSIGHKIILMTGRKESARKLTEQILEDFGIPYDILLMGVGNGERILINDKLSENSFDRALAVNVITDVNFDKNNWKKYGL